MISLVAAVLGVVVGYFTIGQFFIDMEASYFEMPNIHTVLLPVVIQTVVLVCSFDFFSHISFFQKDFKGNGK